jgi:hypothetical protein
MTINDNLMTINDSFIHLPAAVFVLLPHSAGPTANCQLILKLLSTHQMTINDSLILLISEAIQCLPTAFCQLPTFPHFCQTFNFQTIKPQTPVKLLNDN